MCSRFLLDLYDNEYNISIILARKQIKRQVIAHFRIRGHGPWSMGKQILRNKTGIFDIYFPVVINVGGVITAQHLFLLQKIHYFRRIKHAYNPVRIHVSPTE